MYLSFTFQTSDRDMAVRDWAAVLYRERKFALRLETVETGLSLLYTWQERTLRPPSSSSPLRVRKVAVCVCTGSERKEGKRERERERGPVHFSPLTTFHPNPLSSPLKWTHFQILPPGSHNTAGGRPRKPIAIWYVVWKHLWPRFRINFLKIVTGWHNTPGAGQFFNADSWR